MTKPIEKILIVGPVGAGKSYAARAIGSMIDRPVVHLDRLMLDPLTGPKSREKFIEDAEAYFASPELAEGWVADGTYRSLRQITWERADAIGYIRPSLPRNLLRVVQRGLTGDVRGGNSPSSLRTQLARLHATRVEDINKLDLTTQEFREYGTPVLETSSSARLIAAFALYLEQQTTAD